MAETIKIGGELESTATGNIVAAASAIKDKVKNKYQGEINAETDASLADRYTKAETYNKTELNNMVTTPEVEYVNVEATDQTTDISDVLPATGAADTIYKIGSWDGSQYDTSKYSEYTWNGSAYVFLATRDHGIDDKPTAGSNNLVKSGGVQNELALGAVYDVSAKNPTAGPNSDGKFTLEYILDQNNVNTLIPTSVRRGGMSIKFVQSSDNTYVQARCMAQNFTTDVTQWECEEIKIETTEADLSFGDKNGYDIVQFKNGHIKTKNFDSSIDATDEHRGLMSATDKNTLNNNTEKLETIEEGANVNNTDTIESDNSDLSFSDENNNDIVRFANGHVRTKNFDSEHLAVSLGESDVDLSFSDNRGNEVLQVVGGHVKTKHFDSRQNAETLDYLQQEIDDINYESNQILCIGDSLTYGTGSTNYLGEEVPEEQRYRYAAWMATKNPNYNFIALAVGGESSVTILGRMGGVPMIIDEDIILPADTSNVAVTLKSSWIGTNNVNLVASPLRGGSAPAEQINPCYIDGIACTLTLSNDVYYIHRNAISEHSDVILRGSCIKTYNSYTYKPKVMVFWIGTNDHNNGVTADGMINKIKQTVEFFKTDKFVVVNRHALDSEYTLSVAQEYEKKLEDAFGYRFLNWRYYCSKRGIYDAIDRGYIDNSQGTYPTAGDLEDMAAGTVPRTLRRDVVHLVLEGNKLVGDLIYKRLEELNYV